MTNGETGHVKRCDMTSVTKQVTQFECLPGLNILDGRIRRLDFSDVCFFIEKHYIHIWVGLVPVPRYFYPWLE